MNKKLLTALLIFIFAAGFLSAFGNKEKETDNKIHGENKSEVNIVLAQGVVRLVGSALFSELVISGDHEWYIANEDREKLHDLQQRTVTVEGEETIIEQKFLHDLPSVFRRELRNIKIISIR